jgi:hypothetical protein
VLESEIEDMKDKSHKWLPEYLQAKNEVANLHERIKVLEDVK